MFPEDYEITKWGLVLLLISEGFVEGKDGQDLVKLGTTYFNELVNRSLIQPVDGGYDVVSLFCRVHDIVLDFLIHKSDEENLCTLLSKPLKHDSRVRQLLLTGNEDQGIVEQLDLSHVRSLIVLGKVKFFPSLAKSNALRALDLQECSNLENHRVEDIGKLFQLRYLNVPSTDISEIPRQIGDLKYLETLIAHGKIVELPESVTKLQRLERLFVNKETKFPDGIGNMKKLQRFQFVNPLNQSLNFIEELGKLSNMEELVITWDPSKSSSKTSLKEENVVLFFSIIRKLETCKLATTRIDFYLTEDLDVSFPALTSFREIAILSGQLRWIRKWLVSLINLKILLAKGGEIEQQDVEMVGSIPTLIQLKIWCTISEPIIIRSRGFQQLRWFVFYVTNDLVFEAGAMPNLKDLNLKIKLRKFRLARGGRAGGFDFGIHHLSSLSMVHVHLNCFDVRASDVEAAEDAVKRMVDAHPNHPTLKMARYYPDED